MGRLMNRVYHALNAMSPEVRQIVTGAGMALDALPVRRYQTFITNDISALRSDWEKVAGDMWVAVGKAEQARHESSREA